ncbi:MAG: hypothetical protein KIT00_11215 [Rhodospirillales bacterium]|nr:hypothetical protein [Rhodospirillales bacterium]
MTTTTISRRCFVKASAMTATAAFSLSLIGRLGGQAWAMTVKAIDATTADTLLAMCRRVYPHDRLEDVFYAACVEGLDAKAADSADAKKQLTDGAAMLNKAGSKAFAELGADEQLAVLKGIETTPFFQTVRGNMVTALYGNSEVWPKFGYQGPSYPYGGYLERGFNDIAWLPKESR